MKNLVTKHAIKRANKLPTVNKNQTESTNTFFFFIRVQTFIQYIRKNQRDERLHGILLQKGII